MPHSVSASSATDTRLLVRLGTVNPLLAAFGSFGRLSSIIFFVCIELPASGVPSILFLSCTSAIFTSAVSWHKVYDAAESKNAVECL